MIKKHYITNFFIVLFLLACDNISTNSISKQSKEIQTSIIPIKETIDKNFNDFIFKFSTDSIFQINRTKFPLKMTMYDTENDCNLLIYKDRSSFEMMDFSKIKSADQYDLWEQNIIVDKNNSSAKIEIRGIENGISIEYCFKKINGAWILFEINDSST